MKKYIVFMAVFAWLLQACETEHMGPTLKVNAAPSITSPAANASFVLTEDKAAEKFADFTWTAADFGFSAPVDYKMEMDVAGNNFADPVNLGAVKSLSLGEVTIGTVNNALIAKDLPGDVAATIELRVAATVSEDVAPAYSNVVTIQVTPYASSIVATKLQVPGSYQGWDVANDNTVIYSVKADKKYEGFVYFPDPATAFKLTDGNSWDVNWGDDGADGTLDPGGADIIAADAGGYRLKADINALTYTYEKANWGLIGSATPTGWDSDTDMVGDPATGNWSITTDLVAGEIKFRANDEWVIEFGDNDANSFLDYGGSNIVIAEDGNYTIHLILNVAKYTYTIQKN